METTKQAFDSSDELCCLYQLIRKLQPASSNANQNNLMDLFPRKFILKVLDTRLTELDQLATELSEELVFQVISNITKPDCNLLDEYFHSSLIRLHDFTMWVNWHEQAFENLKKNELAFVKSNLHLLEKFISFRFKLDNLMQPARSPPSTKSPAKGVSQLKSNLVRESRIDSPSSRRRVRFSSMDDTTTKQEHQQYRQQSPNLGNTQADLDLKQDFKDLKDYNSVLALELLLFAVNLFACRFTNRLLDEVAKRGHYSCESLLGTLKASKQRLRSTQLRDICSNIRASNTIYVSSLKIMAEIRKLYLSNHILNTLCSQDQERLVRYRKGPRVLVLMEEISKVNDRVLVHRLARQCLQVILDLTTFEINLAPIELEGKMSKRDEVKRSRENYFGFISSWLNIDNYLFGLTNAESKRKVQKKSDKSETSPHVLNESNLANAENNSPLFKSSSRIMAQMDNLSLLAQNLLESVITNLSSARLISYFLQLVLAGFECYFDLISVNLANQLQSASKEQRESVQDQRRGQGLEVDLSTNIDMIVAKVRCLKFVHAIGSNERLIRDLANRLKIDHPHLIVAGGLEQRLIKFSDNCHLTK